MAFFEKTKIADTDGDVIQPAREDGILLRIFNLLSAPLGFDKSLSRQRVTAVLEAGAATVGTVTANQGGTWNIGTVTALTTIDGRNGVMLINQTNLSAWRDCVRSCIT